MNREELLMRLRKENERSEPYEAELERRGAAIAATAGFVLTVFVFLSELILHGRYNFGAILIFTAMYTVRTVARAITQRSVFNTVIAVISCALFAFFAVLYIVAVCNGWF